MTPNLLATNAHVVEPLLRTFPEPNPGAALVQHETGDWRSITRVWAHPQSDPQTFSPDLGLLGVDEEIPVVLPLADAATVQSLAVFDKVSLCGFPDDVTQGIDSSGLSEGGSRPRATCLSGSINALRTFDVSVPESRCAGSGEGDEPDSLAASGGVVR